MQVHGPEQCQNLVARNWRLGLYWTRQSFYPCYGSFGRHRGRGISFYGVVCVGAEPLPRRFDCLVVRLPRRGREISQLSTSSSRNSNRRWPARYAGGPSPVLTRRSRVARLMCSSLAASTTVNMVVTVGTLTRSHIPLRRSVTSHSTPVGRCDA